MVSVTSETFEMDRPIYFSQQCYAVGTIILLLLHCADEKTEHYKDDIIRESGS